MDSKNVLWLYNTPLIIFNDFPVNLLNCLLNRFWVDTGPIVKSSAGIHKIKYKHNVKAFEVSARQASWKSQIKTKQSQTLWSNEALWRHSHTSVAKYKLWNWFHFWASVAVLVVNMVAHCHAHHVLFFVLFHFVLLKFASQNVVCNCLIKLKKITI